MHASFFSSMRFAVAATKQLQPQQEHKFVVAIELIHMLQDQKRQTLTQHAKH